MAILWINVTPDDIAFGTPRSGLSCPIARAIKRELPPGVNVSVGVETGMVSGLGVFHLPEKAREFIQRLDRRLSVKPIVFSIEITKPRGQRGGFGNSFLD